MAIEDYRIDCKYRLGTIKPRLYLIKKDGCRIKLDAIHKNVSFSLTQGNVYYIDADSADYNQTVTDDNRWAFANQLTFRVNEIKYNTFFEELRDICTNDYFYVITDMENNSWLINAETYSDVTYTYTFTNGEDNDSVSVVVTNHTNYPLLLNLSDLSDATPIIQKECDYNNGKPIELYISSIRDNEWKRVDFLDDTFTFTQTYDGELVDRTLTFSIPLDEKFSFAYNLLEYDDNTYKIKFTTSNDNVILCGNKYRPTHTIDTSEDVGNPNLITFTFNQVGNYCYNSEDTSMWKKYKWEVVKVLDDGQAVYEELVSYNGLMYRSQQEKVFTEMEAPLLCTITDTTFDKETYCITVTTNAYKMELSLLELEGTLNASGVCFDKEYIKTKEDGIYAALNVRLYCTEDDWFDKNYHDQKIWVEIKDGEIIDVTPEDEEGKISRWTKYNINEDYYCEQNSNGTYTKWYKEYEEVSYDGGKNWEMSGNYRRGDKVNKEFSSCDEYWDGVIYRWYRLSIYDAWYCEEYDVPPVEPTYEYQTIESATCEGYTNVVYTVNQRRVVGTNEWETVETTVKSRTENSVDCGYVDPIYGDCRKLLYTTSNGEIQSMNFNDPKIISNTYENGQGIVLCDDNITYIKNSFLQSNKNLTSIEIPSCVTSIGLDAFEFCTNLTTVTFGKNSQLTTIGESAFGACTSLTSFEIPSGVTSIGDTAFSTCTSLTSIGIPSGVTSIGNYTFTTCRSLTSVEIPNSVTSIGEGAFWQCSDLTSINIPSGVTSIIHHTFGRCSSLTSITIPNGVTSIGDNAFVECVNLTSVTIPNSVTSIGSDVFGYCTALVDIVLPEGLTEISIELLQFCESLTSVTIPSGVTSIGNWAFIGCTSLKSITYNGTSTQFTAITKGSSWKRDVPASCIVHCTDGDFPITQF